MGTTHTALICMSLNTSRCTATVTTTTTTTTVTTTTRVSTTTRKLKRIRTTCTSSLNVPNMSTNMVNNSSLALIVDPITTPSRSVSSLTKTVLTTSGKLFLCRRCLDMVTMMNLSSIFL